MSTKKRTLFGALCGAGVLFGTPTLSHAADRAVQQDQGQHDDNLELRLRSELAKDARLKVYDVKVDVDDGVATLKGDVPTQALKQHAQDVVERHGVTRVKNDLDVDKDVKPMTEKAQLDRRADLERDRGKTEATEIRNDADRKAKEVKNEAEHTADALENKADHAADRAKNDARKAKVKTQHEVHEPIK